MSHIVPKDELSKFRYWQNFLKCSESYRKLCDFMETKKELVSFDPEIMHSWCPASSHLMKPYNDWIYKNISDEELSQMFNSDLTYRDVLLRGIYPLFQNINASFSTVQHRVELFYDLYDFETIKSAKDGMLDILSGSFSATRSPQDEPIRHLKDVQLDFEDYIEGNLGPTIVKVENIIQINSRAPKSLIMAQFEEYLNSIYESQRDDDIALMQPFFTTGSIGKRQLEHWDDYLNTLRALNKASNDKPTAFRILYGLDDNEPVSKDSRWEGFKKRVERAQSLLHNAESGTFPQKTF